MTTTFVFVHGSGGTGRTWGGITNELALRGHRSFAVDLPGRGAGVSMAYHLQDMAAFAAQPSEMTGMSAARNIECVVDTVRAVREHGPVVLVGHSFGGIVVTGVGNEIPELLDRIVYVSAQCPVDSAPFEYLTGPEWGTSDFLPAVAPLHMGNPVELGYVRVNWRGVNRESFGPLKNALGAELTDEEFLQFISTTQPDEVAWMADPEWDIRAQRDTWGRIPRTFVRLTNDRAFPLSAQDRYIREADALTPDNPFEVHSIASSHSGFLRRPGEAAEILAKLA